MQVNINLVERENVSITFLNDAWAIIVRKSASSKITIFKDLNSKRKMAMRSVVDILRNELDVDQDDAFDYIRTHRDDLFDGTVDAFSKEEVVDDYNEYSYLNKIDRDADQADYQVGPER